ncbi:CLUMA_CG021611, isoform A [Clunio marinus]|uniref:CLUMA_CG021611, isoform A n=1 Tax=Clunio marinus TaxID=568069 RepID=A0A1J1JA44_9DIPT|nr:CLUMA_CG021611, isoform A [Clunio marinus]
MITKNELRLETSQFFNLELKEFIELLFRDFNSSFEFISVAITGLNVDHNTSICSNSLFYFVCAVEFDDLKSKRTTSLPDSIRNFKLK